MHGLRWPPTALDSHIGGHEAMKPRDHPRVVGGQDSFHCLGLYGGLDANNPIIWTNVVSIFNSNNYLS